MFAIVELFLNPDDYPVPSAPDSKVLVSKMNDSNEYVAVVSCDTWKSIDRVAVEDRLDFECKTAFGCECTPGHWYEIAPILGKQAQNDFKVCPRCGTELFSDMKVCYMCLYDYDREEG